MRDDDDDDDFRPRRRRPRKSNNAWLIVGIVGGVIGGGFLLCGGACLATVNFFLNDTTRSVQDGLTDNDVVREHIGEVHSFQMEKWDSLFNADEDDYIFRVEGSLGSGTLTAACWTDDDGIDHPYAGELVMDNGETFNLFLDDFTEQVRADLAEHPVIVERIGEIEEFVYDEDRSVEEEGADVYVFQVRGNKGAGLLRAACIEMSADEQDVVAAELILDSSEQIQLFPDRPLK